MASLFTSEQLISGGNSGPKGSVSGLAALLATV